jgi:hypothetical protein
MLFSGFSETFLGFSELHIKLNFSISIGTAY